MTDVSQGEAGDKKDLGNEALIPFTQKDATPQITLREKVAEAMGWTNIRRMAVGDSAGHRINSLRGKPPQQDRNYPAAIPDYPNSLDAVMELVEELREHRFALFRQDTGLWDCSFYLFGNDEGYAVDKSPATAICLAYLKVKESEPAGTAADSVSNVT